MVAASLVRLPVLRRAIVLINDERPDVATLDLNIGDRAVLPVAEKLQSQGVPIVVSSGRSRYEAGTCLLDKVPWLPKPVDADQLLALLDDLLNGADDYRKL
jgi:two-component system, response regulator PdtaR